MLTGDGKFNIVILFIFQSNENIPADIDSIPYLGRSLLGSWPDRLFFNLLVKTSQPVRLRFVIIQQSQPKLSDRNLLGTCQDRL